ncbi:hypothetical protein, partial [Burkholderia mallei]|uniref:hypothetical protein n=1 Tax=Burkholderia mallei TaxID=13373 RepID=UPI001E559293
SSSSVTISSSCCVGMGVFSITPLKTKSPTWRGFVSNLNPLKPAGFLFFGPKAAGRCMRGARA